MMRVVARAIIAAEIVRKHPKLVETPVNHLCNVLYVIIVIYVIYKEVNNKILLQVILVVIGICRSSFAVSLVALLLRILLVSP